LKFKSIKGTKDILPDETHRWQFVEQTIRSVMQLYNYREIRTPAFEETALFARGIGELTDIVGKEMYSFRDRSETSLTLKPEMTASVIRAYIQHNLGEQQPLVKVFYIAPMFRQERPQAGRLRQALFYLLEFALGSAAVGAELKVAVGEEEKALRVTVAISKVVWSGRKAPALAGNADSTETKPPELKRRLGLAIARRILESAGGRLQVENSGEKSWLEVRLPSASCPK